MPTAVKMAAELEGEFNTLFVESQGHEMSDVAKLALDKGWFGTDAMWTTERPVVTGARGIPNFVLLSSAGEVVMMGHPVSMHGEIEEYIKSDKKRRGKLPSDMPKSLGAAWKSLAKGDFAKARAAASKIADAGGADADAASTLVTEIDARAGLALDRVAGLIDAGFYARAADTLKDVAKKVDQDQAKRAQELAEQLKSSELAEELKAEKALAKVEKKLFKNGPKGIAKKLAKLVETYQGSKAANRAEFYLDNLGDSKGE